VITGGHTPPGASRRDRSTGGRLLILIVARLSSRLTRRNFTFHGRQERLRNYPRERLAA
jgi:hypothetical protein